MSAALRIAIGASIFAILAIVDLRRHGRAARRWREYACLLAVTVMAMAYGAINDQITSRISWEYFYYGKELDKILGPQTPPDPAALHWQAMKVGLAATWSVGLLMGVALLMANNPSRRFPQLSACQLLSSLAIALSTTVSLAAVLGWAGWHGYLDWMSSDFSQMETTGLFRPQHFLCTFGVHLGGYLGGAIGTVLAVIWVRWRRKKLAQPCEPMRYNLT